MVGEMIVNYDFAAVSELMKNRMTVEKCYSGRSVFEKCMGGGMLRFFLDYVSLVDIN